MTFATRGSSRSGKAVGRIIGTFCVLMLGVSTSLAQALEDGYRVFRPAGTGPYPAVALVSGCSGFAPVGARKFYERVGEKLSAEGHIVVFVDYVGRRGLQNCVRAPMVTEADAAKDLVNAVTWLRSQPSVDKERISALGWSYGGGAVLVALAEDKGAQLGLSRAIVYYPFCRAVRPWKVGTPVLMLLAGDDEVAPSSACRSAAGKSAAPNEVKIVTYHGALHAFDVAEIPEATRGIGGAMGHNPQAAAAAWEEVRRFLVAAPNR